MKNLTELLKDIGIEIPEDKVKAFNKAFAENYKTVEDYNNQKTKLEGERDTAISERDTAVDGLKQFEGIDKKKYDDAIAAVDTMSKTHAAELAKIERQRETEAFFNSLTDKFVNDETREYYTNKLEALLDDEKAKGKSRQELLDSLTKDEKGEVKPNIFQATDVNPNRISFGLPTGDLTNPKVDKKAFQTMGYKERIDLYNTNPTLYNQLKE